MVTGKKMPTVGFNKSLNEALKIMNHKKLGMIVLMKNNYIKSVVTDGDLRRELNNYKNLKNLNKFVDNYPYVVNENMPAEKALSIMNEKKITSLLVVSDKDFRKKNKKLKGIIHIHFLLRDGVK